MRRKPVLGVLVVERPRGYDDKECEGGPGEANVECQSNILLEEADDKGDDLWLSVSGSSKKDVVTYTSCSEQNRTQHLCKPLALKVLFTLAYIYSEVAASPRIQSGPRTRRALALITDLPC